MTIRERIIYVTAAVLLIAGLGLGTAPAARAASVGNFADVSASSWYYDAVSYVTGQGLFQGTSSESFSPGGGMTRGMFITVLGRYAGIDPDAWRAGYITGSGVNLRSDPGTNSDVVAVLDKQTAVTILGKSGNWYKVKAGSYAGYVSGDYVAARYHRFSDVDYGAYYAGYAIWAYEQGVVNGMGLADIFAPGQNVTREQACCLLARYASAAGLSLSQTSGAVTFTDDEKISSWAKSSVYAMQCSGVVNGKSSGAFDPASSATRAEAAAMFQRFAAAAGREVALQSATPTVAPTPMATDAPAPEDEHTVVPPAADSTPAPETVEDTPATFVDGSVSIPANVIRVGLLVKTKTFDTCVTSVTLQNTNGSGFEYGYMSDRQFVSMGSISDTYITVKANGATLTVADSTGTAVYSSTEPFAVHPVCGGKASTCLNGKYNYNGDFELRPAYSKSGYITVINYVDIEDYVKGVIPYEFSPGWPAETLKAASVASRTQVMSSVSGGVYAQFGMDLVADDGTQLYLGRCTYSDSYFAATDAAVDATQGVYLTYNGSLCVTSYSACDGGMTKSSYEVFGTDYPYLAAKEDPYEQKAAGDIGDGYDQLVRSSHRVGMSQWGAYAMSKYYNKDYQDILGFYYTGTHLQYGG